MILVSGAAGKTGLAIIRALAARGAGVRAFVRDTAQAQRARQAGAADTVCGDMVESDAWEQALRAIRAAYHIAPNMNPQEAQIGALALQEARRARVAHFVYHSVMHPQTESMSHHWQKLRVEERVFESGIPFTILQPAAYMQNILASRQSIVEDGVFRVPYPVSTRLSLVHLSDVAQAAARVLTEAGHAGATYELVGTPPLAQLEVAGILGRVLGKDVRAQTWDLEDWRREAEQNGLAPYALETLLGMFRYYADYGFEGNPNVLTWLLRRKPKSLADFAGETFGDQPVD